MTIATCRIIKNKKKQGPQGRQKLSSLKSHKIQNPSTPAPSNIASLSNSRWQNRKNKGDMAKKVKRP